MTLPNQHFRETERLLRLINTNKIANWFLNQGYYPEQYVMPPLFKVNAFALNAAPYFLVDTTGTSPKFDPTQSDLVTVSFPKSQLTDRTFGIINPKIYHDIVWYLMDEWNLVLDCLFHNDLKIFSYSLPIPVTSQSETNIGELRSGRMIYEFIEMAENDLVAEAHKYKVILKTDIKNFYPSVYTHSIAWALHTKRTIRTRGNRSAFDRFLGLKLDKLFQYANDGCTNGIPIGPAVSDLISEIILAAVDLECSKELVSKNIDFIGVRFKDDYRFLCHSKSDAQTIIKTLQSKMRDYNLSLNESKSIVKDLPEGLFREWTSEYQKISLRYKRKVATKRFEMTLLATLKIDQIYPDTGVIDRFLSELTTKDNELKLTLKKDNEILKVISLLLMLKERRAKSFPQILAIVEKIMEIHSSNANVINSIKSSIKKILNDNFLNEIENQYDLIWLVYFVKALNLFTITYPRRIQSELIKSLKNNTLSFFSPIPTGIRLHETIKIPARNVKLLEYLAIFKKS